MNEKMIRLVLGKINCVWAGLNVDIDPFVVVLNTKGEITIVKEGNNLAEHRGGSWEESCGRAKKALEGKRLKGGSRIYWMSGKYPDYRRVFLGSIGVSGLCLERDHVFARRLAGFRSHLGWRNLPFFDEDLKPYTTIPEVLLTKHV